MEKVVEYWLRMFSSAVFKCWIMSAMSKFSRDSVEACWDFSNVLYTKCINRRSNQLKDSNSSGRIANSQTIALLKFSLHALRHSRIRAEVLLHCYIFNKTPIIRVNATQTTLITILFISFTAQSVKELFYEGVDLTSFSGIAHCQRAKQANQAISLRCRQQISHLVLLPKNCQAYKNWQASEENSYCNQQQQSVQANKVALDTYICTHCHKRSGWPMACAQISYVT